jgi:hypothetical protein
LACVLAQTKRGRVWILLVTTKWVTIYSKTLSIFVKNSPAMPGCFAFAYIN